MNKECREGVCVRIGAASSLLNPRNAPGSELQRKKRSSRPGARREKGELESRCGRAACLMGCLHAWHQKVRRRTIGPQPAVVMVCLMRRGNELNPPWFARRAFGLGLIGGRSELWRSWKRRGCPPTPKVGIGTQDNEHEPPEDCPPFN